MIVHIRNLTTRENKIVREVSEDSLLTFLYALTDLEHIKPLYQILIECRGQLVPYAISNPCDRCGENVKNEFLVPENIWMQVTGNLKPEDGDYCDGYWCLDCFVSEARRKGLRHIPFDIAYRRG